MAEHSAARYLIIETSTRIAVVAVAAGERVLSECCLEETRRHARDLAPAVSALLRGQGWKPDDIEAVLVSRGPGSYTGLRVGLISAKTFAYATECLLIALDTFAALAEQAPGGADSIDVLADAQQDRVYLQRFARVPDTGALAAVTPLTICPFADWMGDSSRAAWVTGPGLHGKLSRVPATTQVAPESAWAVRAETLARLGARRMLAREFDDPWSLEPVYLRPSAAEQQWELRSGGRQRS